MRLESFDKGSLTVCVKGGGCDGWRFLGRLSSLIMVASDCAVQSIIINPPGDMTVPISRAIEQLVRSNPVVVLDVPRTDRDVEDDFGYVVLGRDEGFLCLRDALDENR
ncbi:MAG: hypothetical protein KAX38_05255, partial [Candidatus Krumholzibacteria bacterium]|nr:hypothetical protein [Candidatus Krumholzibacteria bacterium]